jgi:tRNA(Ile)-lysidine synthase
MALLHLAVAAGCRVAVATVDHGLRPEAAAEAAEVARVCAGLGVTHRVLHWRWDGQGNLQDAARRGRLALLADWARGQGVAAVALGHTQDDVAETFLMRLSRKAGVDGLAAMAVRREVAGVVFLRPLLTVSREELRAWLLARGIGWAEDPSNSNPRFERVRARAAVAALADLGVGADDLAALAQRMADVRAALEAQVADAAARMVRVQAGDVLIDQAGFMTLPVEIRRRLLLAAVLWINSAEYGPRGADLDRFRLAAEAGRAATLAGCQMTAAKGVLRLGREPRAVAGVAVTADQAWDGRWRVSGPDSKGLTLAALGDHGLLLCPDWRRVGLPRRTLLASPALWRQGVLVAAPLAGFGQGWTLRCDAPKGPLAAAPLSH